MKALILAAGYNTRFEQDIAREEKYASLRGIPKALLPVGGEPLLQRVLGYFQDLSLVPYLITNEVYLSQFRTWSDKNGFPRDHLLSNGSTHPQGALRDLRTAVQQLQVDDDLLILASDTLFYPDFSLADVVRHFQERKHSMVGRYWEKGDISKRGVMEITEEGRVERFMEKPKPGTSSSRWASVVLYLLRREDVPRIEEYLTLHTTREDQDALGRFLAWFHQEVPLSSYVLSGRHDVGTLPDYLKTCEAFLL